jgi:hypothetical protein
MSMQFSQENELVGRDLVCGKCNRTVARVIDDVYMKIGNALFYQSTRFSCVCGKALHFRPKDFDMSCLGGETKEILNNLGSRNKYAQQKTKRKG